MKSLLKYSLTASCLTFVNVYWFVPDRMSISLHMSMTCSMLASSKMIVPLQVVTHIQLLLTTQVTAIGSVTQGIVIVSVTQGIVIVSVTQVMIIVSVTQVMIMVVAHKILRVRLLLIKTAKLLKMLFQKVLLKMDKALNQEVEVLL